VILEKIEKIFRSEKSGSASAELQAKKETLQSEALTKTKGVFSIYYDASHRDGSWSHIPIKHLLWDGGLGHRQPGKEWRHSIYGEQIDSAAQEFVQTVAEIIATQRENPEEKKTSAAVRRLFENAKTALAKGLVLIDVQATYEAAQSSEALHYRPVLRIIGETVGFAPALLASVVAYPVGYLPSFLTRLYEIRKLRGTFSDRFAGAIETAHPGVLPLTNESATVKLESVYQNLFRGEVYDSTSRSTLAGQKQHVLGTGEACPVPALDGLAHLRDALKTVEYPH
jgi:hypothetical protein